jgi:hypothetical protein
MSVPTRTGATCSLSSAATRAKAWMPSAIATKSGYDVSL